MSERKNVLQHFMDKGLHIPADDELMELGYIGTAKCYEAIIPNVIAELEFIDSGVEHVYDSSRNLFIVKDWNGKILLYWPRHGKWKGSNKQKVYMSRNTKDFVQRYVLEARG